MADVPPTLKPADTALALIEMAVVKHNTRWDKTFFKAVLGGVMISFGGLFAIIVSGGSAGIAASNPGLVRVLAGFVFSAGPTMTLLQNFDTVTTNFMIFSMAAVKRKIPWWGVLFNWIIVTLGNLAGSLFSAAIISKHSGIVTDQPYRGYIQNFAISKAVTPSWHQIFLRGVGGNWLICIAVWKATAAQDTISKIFAIWIPNWLFAACGFDHVVSSMFSLPLSIMLHANLTIAYYIKKSLIASYIGNVIGRLLIGLPAVYFYLDDWNAEELRSAEEANSEKGSSVSSLYSQ